MAPSPDTLNSLASKIASLDLTDDEAEVLDTIIDRATERADVAGFTFGSTGLSTGGFRLGGAMGIAPPSPGGAGVRQWEGQLPPC